MIDKKMYAPLPVDSLPEYRETNLIQSLVGRVVTVQVLQGMPAIYHTGKPDTVLVIPYDPEVPRIRITRKWLEGLFEEFDRRNS